MIKAVKSFLALVCLLSCLVIFSAFGFQKNDEMLTRLDLALIFESILEKREITAQGQSVPSFFDLRDDRLLAVFRTLSLKLIEGYPDGSFRPEEKLRNLETICYLQKLARCLRKNQPEAYETRQLMRLFAYQSQPEVILSGNLPAGTFPSELGEPDGFVSRKAFQELMTALLNENGRLNFQLSGRVIHAVTGHAVPGACVAAGSKAVVADQAGNFAIDLGEISRSDVTLFAAAEGFRPCEMKKDLRLSSNVVFRLKPEKARASF